MLADERRIVVAGVCGAGKSTLAQGLVREGYQAHTVAQEHSYAPAMWQMNKPDCLIYLECSLEQINQRRKIEWGAARLQEQLHRLRHAREYSDLIIDTDALTKQEVLDKALHFLKEEVQH